MGDLTDSLAPSTTTTTTTAIAPYSRSLPVREDCWSEEATSTLVDAWGQRYLELNRGNLRQKDWQDVADAVNALHAHSKKTHRTDVQCKNRIDTIKKKYKVEKGRVTSSNGTLTSSWPFFERMDALIGSNVKPSSNFSPKLSHSPPVAVPLSYRKTLAVNNNNNMNHNVNSPNLTPIPAATVVALPQKRGYNSEGYYRNYSAVAAAAAAAESEEEEAEEEAEEVENENEENFGVKRLAKAIERFGEVYERVEAEKLRQMVELEKQRMQFASDLEMQRLRMFTEMQVQLERNKRSKRSNSNDWIWILV
ncbi:trihelix transcription factor ASIL2-like isoform X1 [Mangifera indica]|uniref:trihelix transcription factor ASIL2-like isoform X1 n=1 Tax=Mangifera indica TaxID=29780 RepID=UPI001CFB9CD0|nr:trihelix transcription factor ASIL2-like isoform X1 [Mangifera indica]